MRAGGPGWEWRPRSSSRGNAGTRSIFCGSFAVAARPGVAVVQLALQPGLRDPQLSTHLLHRQPKDLGRLLAGHAAKAAPLCKLRLLPTMGLKRAERIVDLDQHAR